MNVAVTIKYGGVEETLSGAVDEVWVGVNQFFGRVIPVFDVVRDVVLTVDLKKIVDVSKGLVAVAEEGPLVLISKQKLTDGEGLLLKLLAAFIGGRLGVLNRDWLSKEELQKWLGKSGKITGTRLGELRREGFVVRMEDDNYKLSTFGVTRLIEEVLVRIRSKV